uniref:Condensin complex subunit 1 n=1 Tax=Nippostrongylus brasiliensis TaxID=27835 RepID=A0A0N4YPY3_NIPBR
LRSDCLGIPCSAFYRLCSQLSLVEFKELHELKLSLVDSALIRRLLEDLVWISRSILVPLLAEKALLADEHIDFSRLDLDIIKAELGVVDTAETISGKIELGMTITDEDVTMLLRDSMKTGFGEYSWLVENHPELIKTMEHFECLMESLPHMQECVDIRPLQRTMTIIPKFLASLNENDLASCVAKHLGSHNLPSAVASWSEILRGAKSAEKLSVDLITQFLFCSNKRGAEELLGALLENIPIEKRIMAIECIDRFPPCLSSELLNPLDSGSLYAATKRMTEEMPLSRFKKDAIFLIGNLCTHSSMSPSKLLTNVFFPTMSTASKGKAAVAISALINHDKFKQEVMDAPPEDINAVVPLGWLHQFATVNERGSAISLTDLLTFALEYYEAPMKVSSNCKYQFIESVISAVRELLSVQNPSVKTEVNLGEIFSKFQDLFHVFASSISDVYDEDQDWKQKLIELENEVDATQSLPNGTTTEVEDHHEEQGSETSEESSKQHEIAMVKETAEALCSAIEEASQTDECTANSESKVPADDIRTEEKTAAEVVADEESQSCEAHESKSEAFSQEEVQQRIRSDSLVVETGSPRKELHCDASGDVNQSAGDKVAAETETFDWDTLDGSKFEVRKEDILQDLRTFSWALNTIEKWPDCPTTVRDKVLFMASNCRCDLIKTRALEMMPKSS